MFRIEYLPIPADLQRPAPSGAAPLQHNAAGAAVAAGAAEDAANGTGGAEAFLVLVGLLIVGAVVKGLSGEPAPGAPASPGRPMEGLSGEALDLDVDEYNDLFLSNRRHYDAEGKRLYDLARKNAGESGFYAVLEGSNFRRGQMNQWEKNFYRRLAKEEFDELAEETGLNGAKRSRRARRA